MLVQMYRHLRYSATTDLLSCLDNDARNLTLSTSHFDFKEYKPNLRQSASTPTDRGTSINHSNYLLLKHLHI